MTNYEGEISSPRAHTNIQKKLTFIPDEILELASVQTSNLDTTVDSATISSFKAKTQYTSYYDTDPGVVSCLNA